MEFTQGNRKLPATTYIFNMGTATNCPSKALGKCKCASVCYAIQPERIYPGCMPYRKRQSIQWLTESAEKIASDILNVSSRATKRKCTRVRFNESGDFYSQDCVEKLDKIAKILKKHDILTYGYTARDDLNFKNVSFKVKGSGNDNGNNGKTIVINDVKELPKGFKVCPGDCKTCHLCDKKNNIAFLVH